MFTLKINLFPPHVLHSRNHSLYFILNGKELPL